MAGVLTDNARDLERELDWLARVLDARLKSYFGKEIPRPDALQIAPPSLADSRSPWAEFIREHDVSPAVRLIVLLGLVPHVRPQLLDVLWIRSEATQRGFTEFGGVQSVAHGGFVPTGETAAFLLAGDDLAARFEVMRLFEADQLLARHGVLHLRPAAGGAGGAEPQLSGALSIAPEHLHRFTTGAAPRPAFSGEFPARLIRTELSFSDLVLPASTLEQLEEIKSWVLHGRVLLGEWGMRHKLRPGFTSLFHGPPGTGKTLSACLLGKHCGCDVYKIDLSMIVSKYIGETEKNLARIFDQAEHRRWILFFDEADALFGKRTRVDDAHDRFANQEISFLLQRIEEFDGVVILASNFKANIDEAFMRRFQSVVQFAVPRQPERLRIWREAFSKKARLEDRLDLARLAERYELTGGTIMNVVRYASLMALRRGGDTVLLDDVEEGIRRELLKEGRAV
ncbi:ATP-binding protein [Sorangium sp. So ce260]|uniref:ATP-binding protein n=1 Tax=Sorangium sp. So ce260 TaxID=3133291 RepID=UPI003F5DF1F9